MEVMQPKPPYVSFETRAIEDRDATVASGKYVAKDVDYAIITPAGSKDRIEKIAVEWLDGLRDQVKQERFPAEWLRAYKGAYEDWKEGRETPVEGSSILNWPVLSPAQVQQLLSLKVRTVEELATANEELITRIGMGARALKTKAETWLATAGSQGTKLAEQVTALTARVDDLMVRNTSLEEQNRTLSIALEATKTAK